MTESGVIPRHPPFPAVEDCGDHATVRTPDGSEHDLFCERAPGHMGPHETTAVIEWDQEASMPP